MKWYNEPMKNPSLLGDICIILAHREMNRRTKISHEHVPYCCKIAQLGINRIKNRYYDIFPYDYNRLILENPIEGNDYINASWIEEPSFRLPAEISDQISNYHPPQPQTWIATQGPLRQTCYEFLSLCLVPDATRRPKVIIQLAECEESGREKTYNYIPSKVGESIEFKAHSSAPMTPTSKIYRWSPLAPNSTENSIHGHLRVTLESVESGPIHPSEDPNTPAPSSSSFYIKNTLILVLFHHQNSASSSDQPLFKTNTDHQSYLSRTEVIHYQCMGWADRGIPDSIEQTIELINSAKKNSIINEQSNQDSINNNNESKVNTSTSNNQLSPILIHCSAGVGRTGTLIAIASFMTHLNHFNSLSPPDLKVQVVSSLLPPVPFGQDHRLAALHPRLPALPPSLKRDLVAHTIDFLREQRVSMVQTDGQISFVYKSVAHLLDSIL